MSDSNDPRLELARRLGKDIKQARVKARLSQAALGELVGVSRQAVSMWESGKNIPEGHRIRQLHQKIDLTPQGDDRIGLGLGLAPEGDEKLSKQEMVRTYVAKPVAPGDDWFTIENIGDLYCKRPTALGPADLVQCILMSTNTMAPWRFPQDPVFYHLLASVRVGDHVLVGLKINDTSETTPDTPFTIKLLTGLSPDWVRLKQYFPDKEETWARDSILTMHPIIEWTDLYGPFPLT